MQARKQKEELFAAEQNKNGTQILKGKSGSICGDMLNLL
jgi:hypothetical protein